ncbi:hypothetical protein B9Z55_003097 [Caenorhabditis nigoni]|uniref:Sdz-33 F-box domain-containing protein n=1 Tax=Caenorhabditis nigoni TaxID=1611254 RepID=A0A2G5VNL6_9PELO|nr:hypothetical protein B9Z55_003097 [Caenorhabditis nigoni]
MAPNASKLRLLDLPYLPLIEVLYHLSPFELFSINCKYLNKIIKSFGPMISAQYKLSMEFTSIRRISFESEYKSYPCRWGAKASELAHFQGILKMHKKILETWGPMKTKAVFDLGIDKECSKMMFDWAQKYKDSIEEVRLEDMTNSEELLEFMEFFKNCDTMHIDAGDGFRCDIELNNRFLKIENGKWVTVENLFNFHCEMIMVSSPLSLQNKEIAQFLKQWKTREKINSKLVCLSFEKGSLDINKILLGFDHFVMEVPNYISPVRGILMDGNDEKRVYIVEKISDGKPIICIMFN